MRHQIALAVKRLLYGQRGEPYRFAGRTLRYLPGTRPIRTRYANSDNEISRYDALQIKWVEKHLKSGDTALDIGASTGGLTVLMAVKCGASGHVAAFEPDSFSREAIERNFALNPTIKRATIEGYACSDAEGSAEFHSSHRGDANASLTKGARHTRRTTVNVTTVDSYLRRSGLRVPQLVKIDTEGAEIRILRGARKLLESSAAILCEPHPYAWASFVNTFDELQDLLVSYGRRMRYLDQDHDIKKPVYGIALLYNARQT